MQETLVGIFAANGCGRFSLRNNVIHVSVVGAQCPDVTKEIKMSDISSLCNFYYCEED